VKIAELFVNLGLKGDDKATKGLSNVNKGLKEIGSTSLAVKAAIVGVIYGLQKMMMDSAQVGTGMTNFNALTGLSTQRLQEWQYAARQAGVSSDDLAGSVKGVQNSMTNMLLGKGAPEGLSMLANKVGFDKNRARDTFYVMEQMQKFAQVVPPDIAANMLKSFGASESVIAAMMRNKFTQDIMSKAPKFSPGELANLDRVNIAWDNMGAKIKMAFGHFTAGHGLKIVQDISKIATEVVKLTGSLVILADKLKVFKIVGKVFEFLGMSMESANKQIESIKDPSSYKSQNEPGKEGYIQMWKDAISNDIKRFENFVSPTVGKKETSNPSNSVTIQNQNLNFQHDGKDSKRVGNDVMKAIKGAALQMPKGGH